MAQYYFPASLVLLLELYNTLMPNTSCMLIKQRPTHHIFFPTLLTHQFQDGKTAIDLAKENGRTEIVAELKAAGAIEKPPAACCVLM